MKLTPREIATLVDSPDLGSIQKLNVSNKAIDSILGLDACKSLTRLDASANSLAELDGIAAASTLRWLSVAKNQITSLEPLRDLENLEILNAAHNQIQGKISMGKFRSLKALILNDNAGITTVRGLEKLKNLDALVLSHNAIESLGGWLNGVTALQKLSLSYNPLKELTGSLSTCPNLQELRLNHCHLTELPDALESNARLLTLEVGSNKIADFESLEVLKKLPLLRQLTLKGCPVADLPGYQEKILKLVPRLQILDNKRLDGGKKRKDREEMKAWAPARAASDANAIPVAARGKNKIKEAVEIKQKKEDQAGGVRVDGGKKEKEGKYLDVSVQRKEKKQKKEKKEKKVPEAAAPPVQAKQVKKEQQNSKEAPIVPSRPPPAVAPAAPAAARSDDADDDDALDPSTFVASTLLATKKPNNKLRDTINLDTKHTGVVKVSIAAGGGAVDKQKKMMKNKSRDKHSRGGNEHARGANALKALLTAQPAAAAPGGAEDALGGWD
ncbi:putative Malignant fibrous histiocytoma-amplified sequence 1 [Nannochloris sp. 'desiccata']|nr:putative Malignant fibrous histiocytoma-amplified sequence 1 [Chlorella desiccata (nom. nud.)]